MSVFRVKHQKKYVVISKLALENPRLSFKAKGLWAYCMSRPDDWEFRMPHLKTVSKDGEDAIYSAINELIKEGYCRRVQPNNGRFEQMDYEIYEEPVEGDLPYTENPDAGNRDAGNPPQLNKEYNQSVPKGTLKKEKPPLLQKGGYVKISQEDLTKLNETHGQERVEAMIDTMNDWIAAKGKSPYKDYAAALRNWLKNDHNASKVKSADPKQEWKKTNVLTSREAQAQLRAAESPKAKEFFISDKELVRLDSGERISLFSQPEVFEAEMIRIFNLRKINE